MDNADTGAIFPNKSKKSKDHPDFTGSIDLSQGLVRKLVDTIKNGGGAKIRVAGWKNTSKAGAGYLRLKVEEDTYMQGAPRQDNQRAQFRSEGGYPSRSTETRREEPQGTPPWDM